MFRSATSPPNPFLSLNYAPVTEELTSADLTVRGKIPDELDGRFVMIGPNPVKPPDPRRYEWFMGDGMIHGVALRGGRALWYRNRWIRSSAVTKALGEPKAPGPRHGRFDTVNTKVVQQNGVTYALVEAGCTPVELTRELETVAYSDLGGTLPRGFTAHPKRDPDSGELFAVAYYPGRGYAQYLVVGKDARIRKIEPFSLGGGTPMMHDIALTENHVVFFDLPVRFNLLAAVRRQLPFRWSDRHTPRVGVIPREGTAADIRWFEVAPCFVFHTFNSYEEDDTIVLDVVRYEKAYTGPVAFPGLGTRLPDVWRWKLNLRTGSVSETRLDDATVELPSLDERLIGRKHRFGYTVGFDAPEIPAVPGKMIKYDLPGQTSEVKFLADGNVPNEMVFVPREGGTAEDDGWLLNYVYLRSTDKSELVIHHAQDFLGEPVAAVTLPGRVPIGFHCSWLPDV